MKAKELIENINIHADAIDEARSSIVSLVREHQSEYDYLFDAEMIDKAIQIALKTLKKTIEKIEECEEIKNEQ